MFFPGRTCTIFPVPFLLFESCVLSRFGVYTRTETNTSSTPVTRFLAVPELPDRKYSDSVVDQFCFATSLSSTEPAAVQVYGPPESQSQPRLEMIREIQGRQKMCRDRETNVSRVSGFLLHPLRSQ